ncbi:hypothetical protein BHM03_00013674 [Ensete ventricosum]|nr:hypothetical protein BHM03_00013674 [Ensete ventricosum]
MHGGSTPEQEPEDPEAEFVEIDPTGRYGRVAWNQVKVADLLRNADDLDRLHSEVHLLKTLKHKNIIKFFNSWVDIKNDNINIITEVFNSGTLHTSVSVATEMVAELDLTDQDVTTIAAMIDAEIQAYVPEWMSGEAFEYHSNYVTVSDCHSHDSEAEDEVSALPNELDNPAGSLTLERLPSGRKYWSDSPRAASVDSPSSLAHSNACSELDLHGSEDISLEVYDEKGDSFKKDGQRKSRSTDHASPKQQRHSPGSGDGGDNNLEIGSLLISYNMRNPSFTNSLNQDLDGSPSCAGFQLCNRGVQSGLLEGNDKHINETFLANKSEDMQFIVKKLERLLTEQQKELDDLQKKHKVAIAEILKKLPPEQHTSSSCSAAPLRDAGHGSREDSVVPRNSPFPFPALSSIRRGQRKHRQGTPPLTGEQRVVARLHPVRDRIQVFMKAHLSF